MIPLTATFRKWGYDFKLLNRDGDVAVFEQTKPGVGNPLFVTAIVQSHNGYEIAGNKFPPAEHMPSAEQWGNLGWTCLTRERAFEKADELQFR